MAVQEGNKEEKHYGEKLAYDPNFKGPLGVKRSCTDVIFLFIFIVYIGLWIGVACYAVYNGDVKKVVAPKSSFRQQLCGYDEGVRNKPYLMFFDLSKCIKSIPGIGCNTPQVCVEKCPDKPFLWDSVNRSSFNPNDIICQEHINAPRNMYEADARIRSGECARYYLPSKAVLGRCLGSLGELFTSNEMHDISIIENRFNLTNKSSRLVLDSIERDFTLNEYFMQNFRKVVEDLSNCWKELILYAIISLLMTILVMFLLKWFTGIITWGCIISALVLFTFGLYYSAKQYANYPSDPDESAVSARYSWLGLTIFFALALAVGLLMVIFLRKKIMLTIAIFEETSKSVLSNISSLFFPLLPWLLQVAVLVFTVYVALYIVAIVESEYRFRASKSSSCTCTGEASGYKDGSICSPKLFAALCKEKGSACTTASCSPKHNVNYLHAINGFGFLWLTFFLTAFGQMVLAGTFATWYFTFNKDDVPTFAVLHSMMITTRFHIGTLAFGSLIVAIVRAIRIILEYINKQRQEGGGDNIAMQVCFCLVDCCMSCLENVIKFINRNAYIICAIHGTNFCTSAKNAFFLIMRNLVQVLVIRNITGFLILVNELVIAVSVMTMAYFVSFSDTNSFHFNWIPVTIVGVIAFLVATVFFTVFSMGVDTLFICFLEDLERNDGSSQKPYYMSKNLMKVFDVKNA